MAEAGLRVRGAVPVARPCEQRQWSDRRPLRARLQALVSWFTQIRLPFLALHGVVRKERQQRDDANGHGGGRHAGPRQAQQCRRDAGERVSAAVAPELLNCSCRLGRGTCRAPAFALHRVVRFGTLPLPIVFP